MRQKLTDSIVKAAKPKTDGKDKTLSDGGGLYLLVKTSGKYWRYDYQHEKRNQRDPTKHDTYESLANCFLKSG